MTPKIPCCREFHRGAALKATVSRGSPAWSVQTRLEKGIEFLGSSEMERTGIDKIETTISKQRFDGLALFSAQNEVAGNTVLDFNVTLKPHPCAFIEEAVIDAMPPLGEAGKVGR